MSDAPKKSDDDSQDTPQQDTKPSLQDIADQDSAVGGGEAEAVEGPEAGKPKPSGGGGFVWFLFFVILLGGGVAAGWPYIGPKVEPVVADLRNLMGLGPRPTQVSMPPSTQSEPVPQVPQPPVPETSVPEIPAAEAPAPEAAAPAAPEIPPTESAAMPAPGAADLDAVATRLDVLESRVEALGAMSDGDGKAALEASSELARVLNALKDQVAALSERIKALEDGSRADPTAPAQALVLAATQVRARLMGDGPFAAELGALEHIAGNDAAVRDAISRLRPHADVGVPTEAALTARFAKVAKAIMSARTTGEAEGWLGRVKDGLGGLVTVRRTDPAAITDEVERAVAIAEAALELGELAEAVDALNGLEGAPGDAAAAWLGDARARVQAETALEELHRHALAALSAAGGG